MRYNIREVIYEKELNVQGGIIKNMYLFLIEDILDSFYMIINTDECYKMSYDIKGVEVLESAEKNYLLINNIHFIDHDKLSLNEVLYKYSNVQYSTGTLCNFRGVM